MRPILALLAVLSASIVQSQEPSFEMALIKYDGLKQEVLKQRGKVVIVDFWAGY
jgi:hypothetical protein